MPKGDIDLPNESGMTDISRDTEVSTGGDGIRRPTTKTVYYRASTSPTQRAGESDADFSKRAASWAKDARKKASLATPRTMSRR